MLKKFKTMLKTNYKKALVIATIYLIVKWTIILTIGGYLHSKGYTKYWYVLIPPLALCGYIYHIRKKKREALITGPTTEDEPS
ncbi:MAG: hypothetical protein COA69_06395 [Robiginitomaculum sp.]|nr:MAG: hypothetical protein COA69_06395 [Robiginitomaculum sp.]